MLYRLKRASVENVVKSAVVISLIVFIIWIALNALLWRTVDQTAGDVTLWSALEGISGAAAFALGVGGGVVVLVQLNESIDSRNQEVFTQLFERIMSPQQEAARRWIYQQLPPVTEGGLSALSEKDREPRWNHNYTVE